jgi:hypothetical protein
MTTIDNIRNEIIDDLLCISNEKYLLEIKNIIRNSGIAENQVLLAKSQIEMLNMGMDDIKNGRLISDQEAFKVDLEWLNTQ